MIFGDTPIMRNGRFIPDINAIMQAANLYVYCINNPIRWLDLSGLAIMYNKLNQVEAGGMGKGGSGGFKGGRGINPTPGNVRLGPAPAPPKPVAPRTNTPQNLGGGGSSTTTGSNPPMNTAPAPQAPAPQADATAP